MGWGCSSVGRASDRHAANANPFPIVARDFSPRVSFQCRLSYSVHTPLPAIACIYICAYVKDPIVHFRVWWIMKTLKHPACNVGWIARLCHSWLSPGDGNPNFPWEISHWDNTVVKTFFFFSRIKVLVTPFPIQTLRIDGGRILLSSMEE